MKSKWFIFFLALTLVSCSNVKKASFFDLGPSIRIEDLVYMISDEVLEEDMLDKRIARITSQTLLVSYPPELDPYIELEEDVFSIKNRKSSSEIAIKIGENWFVAKIK